MRENRLLLIATLLGATGCVTVPVETGLPETTVVTATSVSRPAPDADLDAKLAAWPDSPRLLAEAMIQEYGRPQESSESDFRWTEAGAWRSIAVSRDARPPLEQEALFPVPKDKMATLEKFGHGLHVFPDGMSVSARGDSEADNRLALNMAYGIVSGKFKPEEADRKYAQVLQLSAAGKSSPEMERLLFVFAAPTPP